MFSNSELNNILILGVILMCISIGVQMKWYQLNAWKGIAISIVLVVTGLFGSRLWYFVENGTFLGRSFYGAIFLTPIVFAPISKLLKIPYGYIMDLCAPAGCLTLVLVKYQCFRDGCCEGIVLFLDANHNYVKFPSQIVEMVTFLAIGIILLLISSKEYNRGKVFLWFLILYGATRFVLDFFRAVDTSYLLGLSAGSFWSLIAFIIGSFLLIVSRKSFSTK